MTEYLEATLTSAINASKIKINHISKGLREFFSEEWTEQNTLWSSEGRGQILPSVMLPPAHRYTQPTSSWVVSPYMVS